MPCSRRTQGAGVRLDDVLCEPSECSSERTAWLSPTGVTVLRVIAELERDVRWSLPALLTVGLVQAVVGGVRRLAAPLVIGTATLAVTLFVTTSARLAQLDSWAWLTIGGVLLIAVAVLVERAVGDDDRDGLDWHRPHETWR